MKNQMKSIEGRSEGVNFVADVYKERSLDSQMKKIRT